jgi:hypothetical protein
MLLALNNGVNSVARVVLGLAADYVGRQNTMITCVRAQNLRFYEFLHRLLTPGYFPLGHLLWCHTTRSLG